jgi:hypothetical protein
MQAKMAVLAEAANTTADGKLNVLGIFNKVRVNQVPFQHPHMAIVVMFEASPGEKGTQHKIRIVLIDEDGKAIAPPPEMNFIIPDNLPGADVEFNLVMNMVGVVFQRFGRHRIDITLDGTSIQQLPLTIQPVPLPPKAAPKS